MTASQATDALLTEHFRYTPLSLIDDIINAVNTILYRAIDAIESGLLSLPPAQLGFPALTPPPQSSITASKSRSKQSAPEQPATAAAHPQALTEIENGVHSLETLLQSTVDKTFDKFEIFALRNYLSVPEELAPWIKLGHYEGLDLDAAAALNGSNGEDGSEGKGQKKQDKLEEIMALRRQVQETRKVNRGLKVVHARNEVLLQHLRTLLNPQPAAPSANQEGTKTDQPTQIPSLSFLTSPQNLPAGQSLLETAQLTTSHLPALRDALQRLKPLLEVSPEEMVKNMDRDGKREERRAYIEGRVRGVMQRERLGGGEGGGGMGGMGQAVGEEEVRGLEGMVERMQE